MSLTLLADSPNSDEPISLDDAKAHLRVTTTDEDDLIWSLVIAAREYAENYTHRAFITRTWEWRRDDFGCWVLQAPLSPLRSVSSIQYVDGQGDTQTLATTEYQVDASSTPGRIQPAYGKAWPATRPQMNAVTVTFVAGYGDAVDVPQQVKQALLLIIGEYYARREHAIVGAPIFEVPFSAKALLMPYVVHGF